MKPGAVHFADKWRSDPIRRGSFFRWLEALKRDLSETRKLRGIPIIAERLARAWGEEVFKSAERFGGDYLETRQAGALRMAQSGILTTSVAGTVKVTRHENFGDEDPAT